MRRRNDPQQHDNITPAQVAEEAGQIQRVGMVAFLVNLGLAALKGVLAVLSGSLAVVASTVDSATDAAASLAVWIGLKLSTRKSRNFPYGLYKIENIIQVITALMIFYAGIEIARRILAPAETPPTITPTVIAGMAVSVLVPLLLGFYSVRVGKRTGSPALLAEGRHRQVDVLVSVVVLAAVVSSYFGFAVDRIAAGLVLLFVGYAGWELLVDGMRVLLDASLDAETLNRIKELIEADPTVTEVRSLVGRNAGRFRFLEAEVALRTDDLEKAHAVSRRIEGRIRQQVPHVDQVLIHYEPRKKEATVIAVPLEIDREHLSKHFGEAPIYYLGVVREADKRIVEERFVANPYVGEEKGKGIKVGQWLLEQGMDRVFTPKSLEGRGSGYVLSDAGVEMTITDADRLSQIKRQWRQPEGPGQQTRKRGEEASGEQR
jgi:cation diffusion facilitator family transporter